MKILFFFLLSINLVYGQNPQNEIDLQVWKPFTQAIMSHDPEKFIALHSRDVVRVERNSKKIFGYDEYKKTMEGWQQWKQKLQTSGTKYTFELRFTERIANADMAYEVGYFKNESVAPGGEKRIGYGKFHVVLRKEDGLWKILVDSDSNEGLSITEKMFLAATPLQ
jgi:ketosteroid isomerase-like protein